MSPLKLRTFLPRHLDNFFYNPTVGASGGVLTAWSSSALCSTNISSSTHTLSTHLVSTVTNIFVVITNVYVPSLPELRPTFLDELKSITPSPTTPWMIFRDFNMIRYPHEKNNANFHSTEVDAFNDCINNMCLIELPLLDRKYTWSNKHSTSTLERLDRAFINLAWDAALPNMILSSLTRRTSDHVSLVVDIATCISKSMLFRFENVWTQCTGFCEVVAAA